jgi:hypothetical protein
MRKVIEALSLALILLAVLPSSPAFAQRWGRIDFPGQSLIDFEESTVEAWVLFEFDPQERVGPNWHGKGVWFNAIVPKSEVDLGAGFSISVGLKESKCLMRFAFDIDGKEVPYPLAVDCTHFGIGKWHHVAAAWRNGRHLRVFLDGKEVGERRFPKSIIRDIPSTVRIVFGHIGYVRQNLIVVDDIRISSIARKSEDLGFFEAPLKADPYTLFLDGFENIKMQGCRRFTAPTVVASQVSPSVYEIIGGRIVPGKVGKGFAFDGRNGD